MHLQLPPDHNPRLDAARRRARWELGDDRWADVILSAYFDPTLDGERLENEKRAGAI